MFGFSNFRLSGIALAVLTAALTGITLAPFQARSAVTTELMISDRHSGLALFGYDAVSYFIDQAAHSGSAEYELTFGGLTWRFRSEANRAAFRTEPDAYLPKFGGYDPMGVVRGVPVAGHPAVFAIYRNQLFLFTTEESRREFLQRPDALLQAARTSWQDVRKTLVP